MVTATVGLGIAAYSGLEVESHLKVFIALMALVTFVTGALTLWP